MAEAAAKKERYRLIDGVRGLCVLGMVIYHTLFDIAAFSGSIEASPLLGALEVIRDLGAAVFILLSGFCFLSGTHRLRRFLLLFIGGIAVTGVTRIVMPEAYVIYGILTFMSISGALMIPLDKLFSRIPPLAGLAVSLLSFSVLFRVNYAYVGTYNTVWFMLPVSLYRNYVTAFFGFPFNGFVSGDYYPLLPWIFVYFAGYFLRRLTDKSTGLKRLMSVRIPLLDVCGRYSLYIYLAHQPLIYGIVWAVFQCGS